MKKTVLFFILLSLIFTSSSFAAIDPRLAPNNKVGINSLSPAAEIGDSSTLVNTNGDWGYVVVTISKNEMDINRWQSFLDKANDHHLIPIIRLATEFDAANGYWKKPTDTDAQNWANFLSKLYFPTQNRYIQIYNEVNRAAEWGGQVDPDSYAKELDKTINALKAKSSDFFVLNAPLDLSLINSKNSADPSDFLDEMEQSDPGIFTKLDGWASHSYPNPGFSASPYLSGKTGIDGYSWELSKIASYAGSKDLPVFITETGWKRAVNGINGLSEDQISDYYKEAFTDIWSDKRVVAVAPFLLNYPESLFSQFSFKSQDSKNSGYLKYFNTIRDMPKIKGAPQRENLASDLQIFIPNFFINSTGSFVTVDFKNTGNYIWDPKKDLSIKILGGKINSYYVYWDKGSVYPGEDIRAIIIIENYSQEMVPFAIEIKDDGKILGQKVVYVSSQTAFSLLMQKLKSIFRS